MKFATKRFLFFVMTFATALIVFASTGSTKPEIKPKGIVLGDVSWQVADAFFKKNPDAIVIVPIGAAHKEHGPHLPLRTDWIQAEFWKNKILEKEVAAAVETISYTYAPAFRDYPASVSIEEPLFIYTLENICESIADNGGPRRFYVIDIGVSTIAAVQRAIDDLAKEGILLRADNERGAAELAWVQQSEGSHADEVETSIMRYIAPKLVVMSEAVRDFNEDVPNGGFTRNPKNAGKDIYSPTGTWGDPTKATSEKGRSYVEAKMEAMRLDIKELREAQLPKAKFPHGLR